MPRKKTDPAVKTKKTATKEPKVVAPAQVAPVPTPPPPQLNEAQKIWEEIKNVQLNMFALPNQTVDMYCKVYPIEPTHCYITVKVSAVLAALEDTLGKVYNFETAGKFVLITRK